MTRLSRPIIFHVAAVLVIAAVIGAAYANSIKVPFLYDDEINIHANPYIRITELSLEQARRAMVQDANQLRPLSNYTFALDYYFHGLKPRIMHVENLIIHLIMTVTVYFLVRRFIALIGANKADPGKVAAASLLAALVWATHPAHVQAVTYLVQRHTLLATLGAAASTLFYIEARTSAGKRAWLFFALTGAAFIIGAGAKEIGLVAPACWLLLELTVLGKDRDPKKRRLAIMAGAAAMFATALAALFLLTRTGILKNYMGEYGRLDYGPIARLMTESRVIVSYLITMAFPHTGRMAIDQEVAVSQSLLDPPGALLAPIFLAALAAVCLAWFRRRPIIAFLALGFLAAAAPESSIIPIDLAADQRLYLYSQFVIPPIVAWLALTADARAAWPMLAAAVVMCTALTASRNHTFGTADELWRDSVAKSPGLARPWANYCGALIEDKDYVGAIRACDRAISLDPGIAEPGTNKAFALYRLGREEEAGALFRQVADNHLDSAVAQFNHGGFLDAGGDYAGAKQYYRRALEADAFHLEARLNLSKLCRLTGEKKAALDHSDLLLKLFPDSAMAWLERGRALHWAGDFERAGKVVAEARQRGMVLPGLREEFDALEREINSGYRRGP